MSEIIRYSPARQAMMKALGRPSEQQQHCTTIIRDAPAPTTASDVIELPRVCSVHGQFYMSRYIDHGHGRIVYARGIKMVGSIRDQYRTCGENPEVFKNFPYGEEICPWCGAEGFAAIKCKNCNAEVCYGRTDSERMFVCHCGAKGRLTREQRDTYAVRPALPGGKCRT